MTERIFLTNEFIEPVLLNSANSLEPLTLKEITALREITKILGPFEDPTILCSSDKKFTISLILPLACELNHKINNFSKNLKTPEAIYTLVFMRQPFSERLSHYETRTIPRIASLRDLRQKKDGFLFPGNADQAAKALELEAYRISMKTPPEQPIEQQGFSFMKAKAEQKSISNRAYAIVELRRHFETHHVPDDCNPWQMNMKSMVALPIFSKQFLCVPV